MDKPVPHWVRLGLVVVLAGPQLLIGLWAMVAPENWFTSFPGVGADLIAGEPPFNRHLATDVGAAFFATGIGLVLAAHWGTRGAVRLALAILVAFTVPHVLYHATHPAPGLSTVADVANAGLLATSVLWAAVFWWGSGRAPADVRPADRQPEPAMS